jgi:putative spermidine/putrescine transport system ATP-binding protein
MVFQNYALFPHMTARRNVAFGLMMQGRPKAEIEKMVDEALALVRLTEQGGKLPGQLSGGQQQRVAIARAIVVQPPLGADGRAAVEPGRQAAPGDARPRSAASTTCWARPRSTSRTIRTRRCRLADRIVVLRDGMVRQVGTPEDLYARPAMPMSPSSWVTAICCRHARLPAAMGRISVTLGSATLMGTPIEKVGSGNATIAIRPEDLTPGPDAPISAIVETGRISRA